MKARVNATGEIVEIEEWSKVYDGSCNEYELRDLTILEDDTSFDSIYWTRLEHQYAGMAMQGFLASGMENTYEYIAEFSANQAHALVEKLKSNN